MRQTDYVILGLLSEEPMTGYQIKQIIDIRFKYFWNESFGQLYPSIKSLRNKGFIEEDEAGDTGRARKTYRLMKAGLNELKRWLEQPVEKESVRLEVLLKMYFSHLVDADVMLGHVLKFEAAHAQDLKMLDLFEKELTALQYDDPAHPTILRVVDFGQKANRAYLDWCDETIRFLESRR